jgi:hypothetical protein
MSDDLKALAQRAQELANDLFGWPGCVEPPGGPCCVRREHDRPLTAREAALGWQQRPFHAYDLTQLCGCCAAYWHAEMAAQALRRAACLAVKYGPQHKED